MRNWRSFYEILKFPLEIILIAFIMLGTGNLLTNPALGISAYITSEYVRAAAEMFMTGGRFVIVCFPLVFLIRLVTR